MVQYTDDELDQKLKEIKRRDNIKINEPGFFEKIYGVLAEPSDLFKRLSYFKPNFLNWLLPLIVYIFVFSICEYIMQNNPEILKKKFDQRYNTMEQKVDDALERGELSRDEAEDYLDTEYEKTKYFTVGTQFFPTLTFKLVSTFLFVLFVVILINFFMNLFYSEIYTFKKTILVFGLSFIIPTFEVLIRTIIVLISGTYFEVLDFSSVLLFQNNYLAYLFSKLNPFGIWFYVVFCLGIIHYYRLKTKRKIFLLVFSTYYVILSLGYFIMQKLSDLQHMQR